MSLPYALLACLAAAAALSAHAQDNSGVALDLDETGRLALEHQPLLDAQSDRIRAARDSAVASGQLPDPVLAGGLTDLTVTGSDRFTLRDETDTQLMIGIRQQFPGGDKRRLRSLRGERDTERQEAELVEQRRMIRREAGLAWLDVWKAVEAQSIVKASEREAQQQREALDIAYRSGRGQQADLLASQVSLELLADQRLGLEQEEWHARNELRRWIGDDADRLICPDLPALAAPDLPALLAQLEHHPHVAAQARAVEVAQADLDLAKQDYKPDWSVQLGYGHRPAFADYASLTFEIGLPFFTRDRQDRGVSARVAELDAADQMKQDWLRQHRAAIQLNADDWRRLEQRIARYDDVILPQASRRSESALASYGAGSGSLLSILDARRSLQDIRMQRLELLVDLARHQVNLQYFAPEGSPS
jgi:cobalt-zinc-cadmium efflux system outer membrane protein